MLSRYISKAITEFIKHYKKHCSYDEMVLFSLAQLLSYGLHRSDVWAPEKTGGALHFFKIDTDTINSQVNFVYAAISLFHETLYKDDAKKSASKSIQKYDALMCDLLNKIVAVVLVKSYDNTSKHTRKRLAQLSQYVSDSSVLNGCLDLVYRYETSDQKHTLIALLQKYKALPGISFTVKCHCIRLIHGELLKCSDFMQFLSNRADRDNLPLWENLTLSNFIRENPVPEKAMFDLRCSPTSVSDVSFFSQVDDRDEEDFKPKTSSACTDSDFDEKEWAVLSQEIERERQMSPTH